MESFKMALLNPLLVFKCILDIPLPSPNMPYVSTLYSTLSELLDQLLDYDEYESDLNQILYNALPYEKISQRISNGNKISVYIQAMNIISCDVCHLQSDISQGYQRGSDAEHICDCMKRLLANMKIDTDSIFSELRDNVLVLDDEHLRMLSDNFIGYPLQLIVDSAMMHFIGKSNRKENQNTMTDCMYTHTLGYSMNEHGESLLDMHKNNPTKKEKSKKRDTKDRPEINVNQIDKKYGCKLKHPKDTIDDNASLSMVIATYKTILAKLLLFLNNINENRYSFDGIFGKEFEEIRINKKFRNSSMWFNPNPQDARGNVFKSRFLSYLIAWIIKNLAEIVDTCFYINRDGKFIEYETKVSYANDIIIRISDLVNDMLSGRDYSSDLLFFLELQFYMSSKKKNLKKNMTKMNDLNDQTTILHTRLKKVYSSHQDISMDTLLKLSYMMVSEDPKVKGRIDFFNGYAFNDARMTRKAVEHLGRAIMKSRDEYGVPPMFEFYIEAYPLIYSRWDDIEQDIPLVVGTMALKYYAFVMNDKVITKRIDKLLGK